MWEKASEKKGRRKISSYVSFSLYKLCHERGGWTSTFEPPVNHQLRNPQRCISFHYTVPSWRCSVRCTWRLHKCSGKRKGFLNQILPPPSCPLHSLNQLSKGDIAISIRTVHSLPSYPSKMTREIMGELKRLKLWNFSTCKYSPKPRIQERIEAYFSFLILCLPSGVSH